MDERWCDGRRGIASDDVGHVALGSVAPVVLRCRRTEGLLRGRRLDGDLMRAALDEIGREVTPIDDVRSTARYRTRVAQNLLREFLSGLGSRQ